MRENARLTLMFCAFAGPPKIVRLHGRGVAVLPKAPDYAALAREFPERRGTRSIIVLDVERISDSCGYAVPFMEYKGDRRLLAEYFGRRDEEFHVDYVARKNATSIDGLPAVPVDTLRAQLKSGAEAGPGTSAP